MSLVKLDGKKRIRLSDLNTRVTFYEYRPKKDSPLPDEYEYKVLYECWARIDRVWLKDLETAKQNKTISDVTLLIRDPMEEFIPTNKNFVRIDTFDYRHIVYNVTSSQPDLQHRDLITIVASVEDDRSWQ